MAHPTEDHETAPEMPARTIARSGAESVLGFTIVHSTDDPEHIGAWISLGDTSRHRAGVLGRGVPEPTTERIRLKAVRQRPGVNTPLAPLTSPSLSRVQLLVRAKSRAAVDLDNVGKLTLAVNGESCATAEVKPGDVIELGTQLVLLVASRPASLRIGGHATSHEFGEADSHGYVGESPAAWQLRSEIDFMGRLDGHVLIVGATGTGKELVANALHHFSERRGQLVSRNAATFPESLVDAELFGNLKDYPNPGMPERKGLVGTADRGSLFLDEFAELAPEAQAKLLRVLDSGEYQTLGESRARRSDFRLIASTNRPAAALRDDLLARFDFRLDTPALSERCEDLTFLVRHLLNTMTEGRPELRERLFRGGRWPLLSPGFVRNLFRASLPTNVRGLRNLLWQAVAKSSDGPLEWPSVCTGDAEEPAGADAADQVRVLERVLEQNGGSIEKSWRALGLSSRFALMRLLRKHGVTMVRRSARG